MTGMVNPQAFTNRRPLLNSTQVATLTGVTTTTLSKWRKRRVGPPFIKIGGVIRYEPYKLDEWLADQLTQTRDAPGLLFETRGADVGNMAPKR